MIANRAARRAVRLDDGREVSFEIAICEFTPHVEQRVWVDVDSTGTRASRLTTVDPARTVAPPQGSLEADLACLHDAGLALELDDDGLAEILDEIGVDRSEATIADIVDAFYTEDPQRAAGEGWVTCDWRTPLVQLVALINLALKRPWLGVATVETR